MYPDSIPPRLAVISIPKMSFHKRSAISDQKGTLNASNDLGLCLQMSCQIQYSCQMYSLLLGIITITYRRNNCLFYEHPLEPDGRKGTEGQSNEQGKRSKTFTRPPFLSTFNLTNDNTSIFDVQELYHSELYHSRCLIRAVVFSPITTKSEFKPGSYHYFRLSRK